MAKKTETTTTETTATVKKPNPAIEQLKRLHSAQAIERKDIGLRDYITKYGEKGEAMLTVAGMMSKFVPKYEKEETGQRGFFTMLYLTDGSKVGAFSNALYEFGSFFYRQIPGYSEDGQFFKFEFVNNDALVVKVTTVPLDGNRSTYNFEIVDGTLENKVRSLLDPAGAGHLLDSTDLLALSAPEIGDDEPTDE